MMSFIFNMNNLPYKTYIFNEESYTNPENHEEITQKYEVSIQIV